MRLFISILLTYKTILIYSNIENLEPKFIETANLNELSGVPLFVSLGSTCEVAHALRECGIRRAAFPFDWMLSLDGEKIIELLKNDFLYFLDEMYLVPYDHSGALLQTYYHLEFLHDGIWNGGQYSSNLEKLRPKYERRVERFRQIKNYPGKVFFIRIAYQYSTLETSSLYYKCKENLKITEEYAFRLYDILKNRFPDLDIDLIIMNIHNDATIEEKKLTDNIRLIKVNPELEASAKIAGYQKFFSQLLAE